MCGLCAHAYQQPQTLTASKKIDMIGFVIGSQHLSSVAEVFALFSGFSQLLSNGGFVTRIFSCGGFKANRNAQSAFLETFPG